MIKEHNDIITYIDGYLKKLSSEPSKRIEFKISYINQDYYAIELHFSNSSIFYENDFNNLINSSKDKYDIITDIYTIEQGRLYVIYLLPVEEVRNRKINRLQNKMEYGI